MNIKQNFKDALNWKNIRMNILICLGITLLISFFNWQQHPNFFWESMFISLVYSFSIGFSIYFLMAVFDYRPVNMILRILFMLGQVAFATTLGMLISNLVFKVIYGTSMQKINFTSYAFLILSGLFFTVIAITIFYYFHLSENRKFQHLKEKQARTAAELTSLRTRINPHFLFNTLNSISGLIHNRPDEADRMLQQLSELLRYNLSAAETNEIELTRELQAVQDYLNIEKIRFGERLDISISNELSNFSLPPLLLLTLVENGIKHGVSKVIEGGIVELKAFTDSGKTIFTVFSTGKLIKNKTEAGFGLMALKGLLEMHYKGNAEFSLENYEDGTLAKIEINQVG